MELMIRQFSVDDYSEYATWFSHQEIASALGDIDDEWLDAVLHADDFHQLSIFYQHGLLAVIGIYLPKENFDYYSIANIAIHPKLHRCGYGSIVLNKIIHQYIFTDTAWWEAIVSIENVHAMNFFEKNGWCIDPDADAVEGYISIRYKNLYL